MTVLITGASGFVGSHLTRHILQTEKRIVSLVHDYIGWNSWVKASLKPTIRVRGEIRNSHFLKRVLNQYEIDTVYHLAAQSIVKRAWKDPVNTFDINVLGTVKLLEACRQLNVERIIVQSTDKVYGNQTDAKVTDRLKPTEPYGTSKICADIVAQTFINTYNMNIIISRCCNIYGYDWNNRIIPNTIRACLRNESPIIFKNDESKRQYIYVDDAVKALQFLATKTQGKGIFNIASKDILSQEEVVLKILTFFPSLKPQYIEKPYLHEIRDQSMKVNIQPSNWKPQVSFEEGIKRTIETYKKEVK